MVLSVIGLGVNDLLMWLGSSVLGVSYLIVKIVATAIVMEMCIGDRPYPHQEEPQAQAQLPPRDRGRQGGYPGRRAPARPSLVPFVFKE